MRAGGDMICGLCPIGSLAVSGEQIGRLDKISIRVGRSNFYRWVMNREHYRRQALCTSEEY